MITTAAQHFAVAARIRRNIVADPYQGGNQIQPFALSLSKGAAKASTSLS